MANPIRQRIQSIINTNYALLNDAARQNAQLRSDIAAIIATLQAGGVNVPDDARLAQIRNFIEAILAGYMFGGVVTPDMPLPAECTVYTRLAFLATTPGTYTAFNNYECEDGTYNFFFWNQGSWSRQTIEFQSYSKAEIDSLLANICGFGGVATAETEPTTNKFYLILEGGTYDNFNLTVADNDHVIVFYDNDAWQQVSISTDLTEVNAKIDLIIDKVATPPTYVKPVLSLSRSNIAIEMGADVTGNLTATFTQNDAGALQSANVHGVAFEPADIAAKSKTVALSLTNVQSTTTISANAAYAEGPTKKNNFDIDDARGKILAGTISKSFTITPSLHYFYGAVADSWTITSANVRALTNEAAGNKTLNTGTTYKKFVLAIPSNKTLTLVKDTATNADITSQYVLQGTTHNIEDAGGTEHAYKVYIMTVAVPFDESHPHAMTIS